MLTHLVGGADGHGRLVYDDSIVVHVRADGLGNGQHVLQVGRAVLVRRRADRDELEQPVIDALLDVGRELEATRLDVALDESVETRLVDRNVAGVEALDLALVDVDAHDVVAGFGHTRARDQANIARPEDGQSHWSIPKASSAAIL